MFQKLEQLRKLPDGKKRLIAFGAAFGITAIIFVFWAVSLSVTLNPQDQGVSGGAVADASSVSPFSALEANVSAAIAPVGSVFHNVASYFSASSSVATTTANSVSSSSPVVSSVPLAASNPPSVIDHLLVPGDSGSEVVSLQKVLAGQGFYNGPLNGKLGPATDAALVRFQAAYNIVSSGAPGSGQAGPKTRDAINQLLQQ